MSKDDYLEFDGTVVDVLPGTNFKVQLDNGNIINAYLGGKMRMNYVKVTVGDKVKVAISVYDLSKGRIIYRNRN